MKFPFVNTWENLLSSPSMATLQWQTLFYPEEGLGDIQVGPIKVLEENKK